MTREPVAENHFHWDNLDEPARTVSRSSHKKLWFVVVLSFLYCVSAFCRTQPTGHAQRDPLADFIRKYLSQTGGYRHVFYRLHGGEADWAVFSRPEKAIQPAPYCYTLVGHGKRLAIHQYPAKINPYSKPEQLELQGRELDSHEFRAQISVKEESNSRFFSSVEDTHLRYSRWLSFSEGSVPCGEVTVSLTQPRFSFLFNRQHQDAYMTCNGVQHISLEDLEHQKTLTLFWDCQRVCLQQQVSLSLADCRDGQVAVQPPRKFWILVGAARLKAFINDGWAVLALSLLTAGLALLAAERLLTASRPAKHSVDHGILRFRRRSSDG